MANWPRALSRLSGRESYLITPARALGCHVVGAIAARLGVQVEARRTRTSPPPTAGTATPGAVETGVAALRHTPARPIS